MTMVDNDDNSQTDLFDDEDLFDALDMMNDTTIKQDKHLCTNCQSSNITNDYIGIWGFVDYWMCMFFGIVFFFSCPSKCNSNHRTAK